MIIPLPSRLIQKQKTFRYCAFYNLKAVIEFFDNKNRDLRSYASSLLTAWHGFMFPEHVASVLGQYNFEPRILSCFYYSCYEKISHIKSYINKGIPPIVLIGHAYNKPGEFSLWKAILCQHYVSVWGYDDAKECLYVYDSGRYVEQDPDIPSGTVAIKYEDFLRYWQWGGLGLYKNIIIAI